MNLMNERNLEDRPELYSGFGRLLCPKRLSLAKPFFQSYLLRNANQNTSSTKQTQKGKWIHLHTECLRNDFTAL